MGTRMGNIPRWSRWNHLHPIYFQNIRYKNPLKEALELTCNNGRAILYRDRFSNWEDYCNPQAKIYNVDAYFLFNKYSEDSSIFRGKFQENLKAFHTKDEVWRENPQSWTEPSKVGYSVYIAHTLQVHYLIKKSLKTLNREMTTK